VAAASKEELMLAPEAPRAGDQPAGRRITLVSRSSLRPGMDVYRLHGARLGRVKAVGEAELLIKRDWLGEVRVPLERVLAVVAERVVVTDRPACPAPSSRDGRAEARPKPSTGLG
jgi:hypothetical protein